ncbi:MAG: LacI family DNA-binding transcriptional regulator [Sphaerochaetaceae bacterium]|jgi:LacI family transcriptional regulator|nr:LacI family DNA-binding transcriptional regulator [Sphaerochaetaceae bacterium]MDX9938437.1 LacI family DNA-binding transcriptional regulator [Sphaerochaetaceae bacterium]
MKVTIKDIAAKAGVSVSAVSFALNDKPGVSKATQERVRRVAAELGYIQPPSRHTSVPEQGGAVVKVLKILRHGHTINASHNFFIDAYLEGINEIAHQQGITIEIGTFGSNTKMSRIVEMMQSYSPTLGYLILGTELSEEDMHQILSTQNNVVFMDTYVDYIPAHFVDMNNTDTVYQAINHLRQYGHKKIGMIKSSVSTKNFSLRERAFHQVMHDFGLEVDPSFIVDVDSTFDGAYRDMLRHMEGNPGLPTAFFATNDIMALGCMKAFHEKGLSIPDDLSLVGFDNLPMSEMSSPPLTTIDVFKHKIAQYALNILLTGHGNKPCTTSVKTLIDGRLISRSSVRRIGS